MRLIMCCLIVFNFTLVFLGNWLTLDLTITTISCVFEFQWIVFPDIFTDSRYNIMKIDKQFIWFFTREFYREALQFQFSLVKHDDFFILPRGEFWHLFQARIVIFLKTFIHPPQLRDCWKYKYTRMLQKCET